MSERKEQKRRSVSFRPIIFQWLRDCGRALEMSNCAVVEAAVIEYCERRGVPQPLRAYWLDGSRARREQRAGKASADGRQHFTW